MKIVSSLTLLNSVLPFLLLPILTFQLTLEEYGGLILLESFIVILTPILQFSIAGLIVEYFKLSKSDFSLYLTNSLIIVLPVFVFFQIIVFYSSEFIVGRFGLHEGWFLTLPIIILFNVTIQASVLVYQCKKKYRLYSLFLLGPNVVTFILTISLLFFFDLGWESKLFAVFSSFFLFSVLSFYLLIKELDIKWKLSWFMVSSNLKFTLPIIPHSVAAGMYFMADRIFISEFLGNASVAIYAAGMQLAMIMSVLQNSLSKAWAPFVMEFIAQKAEEKTLFLDGYSQLFRFMFLACLVVILSGVIISIVIYFLVDHLLPIDYSQAKYLGIMLIGGFCLLGFYKVYTPILWYHKRTGSLSKVTVIVFLINLVLNLLLIPKYGVYGACYATIISIACQFLFSQAIVFSVVKNHKRGPVGVN
ncbi:MULTISPECIES: oligosaccharide flippase family protein [unclassified Pseudoalteromonas]|uniref:lipopolysaccharide biosynthesis protein n=1 Tax=unclassified Pseudoalteromonas TaxID=194690 RepID=UPI0009757958|nr:MULTISPECIES: oligosaccharide flippase family protein [unclassified Pseudoalteromonas]UOB73965.1 oligosaccharide flippase family protein [Pseudoalteromonas sp. APM04]